MTIQALVTFDDRTSLLTAMRYAESWVIIDEAAALRALTQPIEFPPVSHVYAPGGVLKRLDDINLEEAKSVIRRLCDELLLGPEAGSKPQSDPKP